MRRFSFNTKGPIGQQIGDQVVHGVVNNYHSYSSAETAFDRDEAILRSLAFPGMHDRRNNIDQAYPSTCEWIFKHEQYLLWQNASNGLLWIKGHPGSGKSTLMTHFRESFQHLQEICYLDFYFSARGTDLQHTSLGMLRSLLAQLYDRADSARETIRRHCEDKNLGTEAILTWQRPELERLLTKSLLEVSDNCEVNIFVDALDEAGKDAPGMVAFFHILNGRAAKASKKLKICISSRHYSVSTTASSMVIVLEDENYNDIDVVVRERLNAIDADERWLELGNEIVRRARGVFQWVCLALSLVERSHMSGLSVKEIRSSLDSVPQELAEVYEFILKFVLAPESRKESFLLFRWIVLAQRPLFLQEAQQALALGYADEEVDLYLDYKLIETSANGRELRRKVLALSGGLIEVIPSHGDYPWNSIQLYSFIWESLQVIHQSVHDYLFAEGLQMMQTSWLGQKNLTTTTDVIRKLHADIYWTCLKYLAPRVDEAITLLNSSAITEASFDGIDKEKCAVVLSRKYPLLEYAFSNAFLHAERAEHERSHGIHVEVNLLQEIVPCRHRLFQQISPWDLESDLLEVAITHKLDDLIDLALESFDPVNVTSGRLTAIHYAALRGEEQIFAKLLRVGMPVDHVTDVGATALALAVQEGHLSLVTWLFDQAYLPCQISNHHHLLMQSAERGKINFTRLAVDRGADVDHIEPYPVHGDDTMVTALQLAADREHLDVCTYLVNMGANVNLIGDFGTALQAATSGEYASPHILPALLKYGADPNLGGGHFGAPLHKAAWYANHHAIELLLDWGAEVNLIAGKYGTALQAAVESGSTTIVSLLLDRGANINAEGGLGSALHRAAYYADTELVSLLLERGADPYLVSGEFGTALQAAVIARGLPNLLERIRDRSYMKDLPPPELPDCELHTATITLLREAEAKGYKQVPSHASC